MSLNILSCQAGILIWVLSEGQALTCRLRMGDNEPHPSTTRLSTSESTLEEMVGNARDCVPREMCLAVGRWGVECSSLKVEPRTPRWPSSEAGDCRSTAATLSSSQML